MLFVEQELAMLRQLIGQVQELLDLYDTPPLPPPYLLRHPPPTVLQPPPHLRNDRWCLLNLEDNPSEDDCYNLVMRAGKFKMLEPGKGPPSKRARKDRTREKLPETSNPTETMESEIWKKFPEDLYETVIARLPVATFFRFRSVCQKWNSLLTSNSFSVECSQVTRTQPWFYTRTHENVNTGVMYDPVSRKWYHPTAPAVPTKMIILPVASAGGLICFLDIGHKSFYVCNPLTQSFRELQARSVKVWSRVVVGMSVNHKSGSGAYRIMWVRSDGEYEVYDSKSNTWMCPGGMPACIKLPLSLNFRSHPVTVDGCMYFLRSDPDGIVSYDMETGIWKQFTVPAPVQLSDHTLAECGGRIMLVGLVSKNAATCVCIWELQKMSLLWKEVDRMPNVWCLEFYGKPIKMSCLGNRGLLMLSLRSKMMNRLVTYDVLRKEWFKVPNCVFPHSRKRQWIACGTAFHPCLTAKA
ncbi:putative F-box domain, galactose oxidase/kelch, beta-propeller, kelch-type beta propeller [Helianthus annuus]|uniref:F-box domain, galactose oxidase/kelch, beta-propeller, kelch-type beta propeller n=1 Tax=Helianthus annuus TaxID=4232 RepID=A0A251U2N9_HELAN|nr:F-box only protein 6 [Helianthus annuus]KAF5793718.1 putative F-box domain, galactose oxidase/kelch, beta-propeller, kelch-type beta propeller [Helianthus annuus]KAJ0552045.1 putative F-box domain, galactose oxidase/kelch, beta-propeller, kelch-type beta propeller [Helianthus annuus]KAJ0720964.1 putative F-box domain, galactose oxidase/kelch, beta-propeller, kelch-type beta propeller [Helianthus annuus]